MQKGISLALFCAFLLILACFSLQAQNHSFSSQPYSPPESFMIENPEVSVWHSDYYPVGYYPLVLYFPIDKYLLRRDYRSNDMTLAALDEMLTTDQIIENIDTIEILGACSPVASPQYNYKLSYNRCLALRSYIEREHPRIVEKFPIKMKYIGIDYLGYDILSQKKEQLSEKEKWDMLQYVATRLKMKDGSYIIPGYHDLKSDTVSIIPSYQLPKSDTVYVYVRDTVAIPCPPEQILPPETSKRPVFLALKSNLLYDAALLPNLSAEVYLGKQWSLVVEGNWSWWTSGKPIQNQWVHRIQAAGAELRYWVKSPYPLNGHAIGVYSLVGDYDIRMFPENESSTGYLSYRSWSAGLSYAYSMPISNRFNLEFGLAFGYVGGKYYEYDYCMRHEQWEKGTIDYERVYNMNYFGPTRVGISLVWLLGTGNSARDKEKYKMWQDIKNK